MADWIELKRLAEAKRKAHAAVKRAIVAGKLTRPEECSACGVNPGPGTDGRSKIHGHHHNGYENQLDVEWLCARCHRMETPFNVPKGADVHCVKLDRDAVEDIRSKRMSQRQYAKLYGVAQSAICMAQNGVTWAHLSKVRQS